MGRLLQTGLQMYNSFDKLQNYFEKFICTSAEKLKIINKSTR